MSQTSSVKKLSYPVRCARTYVRFLKDQDRRAKWNLNQGNRRPVNFVHDFSKIILCFIILGLG